MKINPIKSFYTTKSMCNSWLILCLKAQLLYPQKKQAVDHVNPLIGTSAIGFAEGKDGGGTMPCVGTPFAMTNFVAQTRENKISEMPYIMKMPK